MNIKKGGILFFLAWLSGTGFIFPDNSQALYCASVQPFNNEMECATVIPFGPITDLVLCQFMSNSSLVARGEVNYGKCMHYSSEKIWECDRTVPMGLPPVSLTESEWNSETIRYSKICGECPSGWK